MPSNEPNKQVDLKPKQLETQSQPDNDELSEEELESVTGGTHLRPLPPMNGGTNAGAGG